MKMHRTFKFLLCGIFGVYLLSGCTKDTIVPIDIEDKVFSFTEDIEPLLSKDCSASSCHGGSVEPGLNMNAYENLLNGGYIVTNPDKAEDSKLYKKLNGTHDDGRISGLTKRSLELWMEQGAENN